METRQLAYFVAVAEERHFGRAAQRLHMAQSPLSQQIRQLEAQIGVQLLDRTTRRVDLTAAGELLLHQGRRILQSLDTLIDDLREIDQGARGVIRLGFTGTAASGGTVPQLAQQAAQALPGLALALHGEMTTPEMTEGLLDGSLDAALMHSPLSSSELDFRTVAHEPLVIALPGSSTVAQDRPLAVTELQDQDFVSCPPDSPLGRAVSELCSRSGFQPRTVQVVTETSTALSFVAAGCGVAILPGGVQPLAPPQVAIRRIEGDPGMDLVLAWRREAPSPLLQRFLHLVPPAPPRRPAQGSAPAEEKRFHS